MIKSLPVRLKLTAIVMTSAALALVLASAAFITHEIFATRRNDQRNMRILADIVASNSTAALVFGDADAAKEILSALRAQPSIINATIEGKDGKAFAAYDTNETRQTSRWGTLEIRHPIYFDGQVIGSLRLVSDYRFLEQRLRRDLVIGAAILACTLLVALLVAVYLQRVVSAPLMRLAAAAQEVTLEKNYAVRVGSGAYKPQKDEIGAVMNAFDEMLSEVQQHQGNLEHMVASRTAELQMILNSAGEGIVGVDRAGRITFVNPAGAAILGWDMRDLTGWPLHFIVHAKDSAEHAQQSSECAICNASIPGNALLTTTFRRSDGTTVPVEITSAAIDDPRGHAAGVVVTFRDITERMQVERMKDEFVSTVSHELRTPLTSIRGALTILGSGALGELSARGQRMMNIAVSNSERLTRLINDLLDLEKMDSTGVTLQRRPLRIEDVLSSTIEAVQPMAERARVQLELRADGAAMLVDGDRIQQMLANLLSNALKFAPEGSVVRVAGELRDRSYVIVVRDHGRGIPADKLEMVFERFQQVDASDSREKGGTGLGLAICRTIANAHGGTIRASNAEDGGAEFTVTLPLGSLEEVA